MRFHPHDRPSSDTDAYRLGAWGGASVDGFSGHWVIETREEALPAWVRAGHSEAKSIWWKQLSSRDQHPPQLIQGEPPADLLTVREHGTAFEVDLGGGYSQGIFLDQRLNRQEVARRMGPGKRLLNLFAYTCGFSVVAARIGASTTSVDLSRNYLAWGKRNFLHNGLDPEEHYFTRGDAMDWLSRWRKSGVRFDGVILDPPTFSRAEGKVFRVERDYGELVEKAWAVLDPGGWLLCCTNYRDLDADSFRSLVRRALGPRRSLVDWPMPPEYGGDTYLKTIWVE
ncbi:MAG: class I SAM-dependent methyltransferase [Verrucomicrobiota bacterium]